MLKSLSVVLASLFCLALSQSGDIKVTHECATLPNQPAPCLVIGRPDVFGDRVIVDEAFDKIGIPLITRTDDLVLPDRVSAASDIITFVQVTNPGDSGQVTLTRGGPGYNTVSLHLASPRGQGYKFQVLIKGRPALASNFKPNDANAEAESTPNTAAEDSE